MHRGQTGLDVGKVVGPAHARTGGVVQGGIGAVNGNLQQAGGFLGTAPALAGNHVFVATLSGEFLVKEKETGKAAQTTSLGDPVRSQVVVMDGMAFIGTQNGKLHMVKLQEKVMTGWATWGGDMQHTSLRE